MVSLTRTKKETRRFIYVCLIGNLKRDNSFGLRESRKTGPGVRRKRDGRGRRGEAPETSYKSKNNCGIEIQVINCEL